MKKRKNHDAQSLGDYTIKMPNEFSAGGSIMWEEARETQLRLDFEKKIIPKPIYDEVERIPKEKQWQTIPKDLSPQKIFISYAIEDFDKAESIYKALSERGHLPWMDKKNLLPGQRWDLEIKKAVEESNYFIACLSEASTTKRGFVQKELKLGLKEFDLRPEGSIYVIPIRLDRCKIPESIKQLHVIDIEEVDSTQKLMLAIELYSKDKSSS